jgi:hypothetical protein
MRKPDTDFEKHCNEEPSEFLNFGVYSRRRGGRTKQTCSASGSKSGLHESPTPEANRRKPPVETRSAALRGNETRHKSYLLSQLRFGHAWTKVEAKKLWLSQDEKCECGAGETIVHRLVDCLQPVERRSELRAKIGDSFNSVARMLGGWQRNAQSKLIQYSGRLIELYGGPGQKSWDYSAFGQITGLWPWKLQALRNLKNLKIKRVLSILKGNIY